MWDCNTAKNQEWAARGNTGSPPAGSLIYKNPVYAPDFADPAIIFANDTYYAYATNGNGKNVQVITSNDLVHWSGVGEALPQLPGWAQPPSGLTWAPAVIARAGRYVLYYTTRPRDVGLQCISRAVANSPAGPFVDDSAGPLICQRDRGGSIDASPFLAADGSPWITWKNDGNCCGLPISLWSQRLTICRRERSPAALRRPDQWCGLLPRRAGAWVGRLGVPGVLTATTALRSPIPHKAADAHGLHSEDSGVGTWSPELRRSSAALPADARRSSVIRRLAAPS